MHISKLDKKRVEKVEDVVKVGDEILVKVMEVDRQGRINLSRKDVTPEEEAGIRCIILENSHQEKVLIYKIFSEELCTILLL